MSTPISKIWIPVVFAIIAGTALLVWRYTEEPQRAEEAARELSTSGWRAYHSKEFGFEIKFPQTFSVGFKGPNYVQEQLNRGEQVSGTNRPSYETIVFTENGEGIAQLVIFHAYDTPLTETGYRDGYLYLSTACDLRWEFVPSQIEAKEVEGRPVLQVEGNHLLNGTWSSCRYFKNLAGNLLVLSGEANGIQELQETKSLLDKLLSTFRVVE